MRAIVVEDERKMAALVQRALKEAGFLVDICARGDEAYEMLRRTPYDVAVLDIMLPGLDGLAIVKRLRTESVNTPILMLTARSGVEERIAGLETGADDYLGKPFAVEELVARVRALMRRRSGESVTLYRLGNLVMDVASRQVSRGERRIDLTAREFALLQMFMRSVGRVFTRTQICEKVWEYHFDPGTNLVDKYVQRLRAKIELPGESKLIHTIRNVGYCLSESAP